MGLDACAQMQEALKKIFLKYSRCILDIWDEASAKMREALPLRRFTLLTFSTPSANQSDDDKGWL